VDRNGRVLYQVSDERYSMIVDRDGTATDYSWLSGSQVSAIAPDGGTVLFTETGGARPTTYIRVCSASAAIRLAEGWAAGLSHDGRFALVIDNDDPHKVTSVPTGAGEPHVLEVGGIRVARGVWSPDGRFVLVSGSDAAGESRTWLQPMADGAPQGAGRALTSESVRATAISPDGKWAAAGNPGASWALYPTDGGAARPLSAIAENETPVSFSADGRFVFAVSRHNGPASIEIARVDIATGARSAWKTLKPADPAGIWFIGNVCITPDGGTVAWTSAQALSKLYLATGFE
jgi:WD40 repeat protein